MIGIYCYLGIGCLFLMVVTLKLLADSVAESMDEDIKLKHYFCVPYYFIVIAAI